MSLQDSVQLRFGKYTFLGSNLEELRHLKQEIFHQLIYNLDLSTPKPMIIDAGAHVGLATAFFKHKWPHSHVVALEPHPENFALLSHNLWFNHLDDQVELKQAALDIRVGERTLYYDSSPDRWYSTASFSQGAWNQTQTSTSIQVPTINLASLIHPSVDLLKLDIEGTEIDILLDSAKYLPHINHLLVECHHWTPTITTKITRLLSRTHSLSFHPLSPQLVFLNASN